MLSRERVSACIKHQPHDRMPIYGWVAWNLVEPINAKFGSAAAFEDHYEFDMAHLFGGPGPYDWQALEQARKALGRNLTPVDYLEMPLSEVNETAAYSNLREQIQHHQTERGRFVYVQSPGIFECLNGVFGIEDHLAYLLEYEDELQQIYARQAQWNHDFAMNCLDLGIDMIHVSDDWGAQDGPLFSPALWWRMIYPHHQTTAAAVRGRGAFLSLHCDGNILPLLDGVIALGYNVVHPWQESAGMSLDLFQAKYIDNFTVMGGLDIQTTLGFGNYERLAADIDRVVRQFAGAGLLFCTSHFVQEHCSIEELTFAYDRVYALVRELAK